MISFLSYTEENYLKRIYHLSCDGKECVNTNALAEGMNTSPASVNDMMKKLSQKNLIDYKKYKGATLLSSGKKSALQVIRKHRLWEVFLVKKLHFNWDEVHDIAEQLEHIKSPILVQRLDAFLQHPTMDPHGDPIPDENGNIKESIKAPLSEVTVGTKGIVVTVNNDNKSLLRYLDKLGIKPNSKIEVKERIDFDQSISVTIDETKEHFVSKTVADNLMITF